MRRSWLRLFWLTVVLAGAVAGYLVSSGLGTRLLHREIETQLTRLLEGPVEIGAVALHWEDGFHVEARAVSAYPSEPDTPDALRARRVLAWINPVALLIGRLELSALLFEGPHLRLEQREDGSFVGLPFELPPDYPDTGLENRTPAEQLIAQLAALDVNADLLADRFRVADRIEVLDGTLTWTRPVADAPPATLRVELLNGRFERNWLSDAVQLDWDGVFVDGEHSPFPFVAHVRRDEGPDQHFVWSLDLSQIPLGAAETPLAFVEEIDGLDGTLDASLHLESQPGGSHQLSITAKIIDAAIAVRGAREILERPRVDLEARLVINPYRVKASTVRLAGGRFEIGLEGEIQRPIRPASPTRLEARILGLDLDDIAATARSLEAESTSALTIARLTEHVQSGQIDYVQATGSAPLRRWQALLDGTSRELPNGFVLSGAFRKVSIASGPDDLIENLEGAVEWADDQLILRNGNALFRGEPLPQLDAVLNGVSHLVRTSASARRIQQSPPPIPGIGPLSQIIKPRDPNALPPIKAIGLAIEHLDHPVLRWPLRDLGVLIEPLRRGLEINVREGTWGGAAVSGKLVWFNDPTAPSLSATLNLGPPPQPRTGTQTAAAGREIPDGRWGAGRFELDFRPRPWLPFQKGTGHFRLEGDALIGDELEIELDHRGTIEARMTLGLEAEDSVGFDTSFALTNGRLAEVGPFVALPAELATGEIRATGSLAGRVRPDTSFVAELDGHVRAEARNGLVYMKLPMMFRLAKATEGFNPFSNENELQYETMNGSFALDHGVISVEDFEIEGPLRVFARADIDTNPRPVTIRAVVGIFLFRKPNQLLESLPVLKYFLPGSERGLIGTYFRIDGPIAEPEIETLPLQSLMSGIPSAIKAPFKALRFLFDQMAGNE